MPVDDVTIEPVTDAEFALLRDLARTIWWEYYPAIITPEQIEYMLAGRFDDAALRQRVRTPGVWLEVLRVEGTAVGYCGSESAGLPWDDAANAMKLGQLYLLDAFRGRGLGRRMLRHVEERARELGKDLLFLQVHKRNAAARSFYMANGFTVAREAVFDIGAGFVMDDFIMEKRFGRGRV